MPRKRKRIRDIRGAPYTMCRADAPHPMWCCGPEPYRAVCNKPLGHLTMHRHMQARCAATLAGARCMDCDACSGI